MQITPQDYLDEALAALEAGHATDAFAIAEAGLAIAPTSPELNQLSGILMLQAGHLEAALIRLEVAWSGAPADPNMALNYAQALITANRISEAEDILAMGIANAPDNGLLLLRAAELAEIRGQTQLAIQYAKKASQIEAISNDAALVLARVLTDGREPDDARHVIEKAIEANPKHFPLWIEKAKLAINSRDHDGAAHALDHILGAGYSDVTAYFLRGNLYLERNNAEEALNAYREALALNPHHASSLFNSGHALLQLNREIEALDFYKRAYAADPANLDALCNFGTLSNAIHQYENAIVAFTELLEKNRNYRPARNNRAHAYRRLKRYSEAISDYQALVATDPQDEKAYFNLALAQLDLKDFENALGTLTKSLAIKPDYLDALVAHGLTLYELDRYSEALKSFDQAIKLSPLFGDARLNRGHLRRLMNDFLGAIEDYDLVIREGLPYKYVLGDLLYCKMQICEWNGLEEIYKKIETGIQDGDKVATPFALLSYGRSAAVQKRCAEIYCQSEFHPRTDIDPPEVPKAKDKIRIGYFSADFHDHATMHLMAGLFESHDRDRFEIYAFSFGPVKKDTMRARAEAAFDYFVEASELSDKAIALLARHFEIDIAIDLKGFTTHSRAGIFSYRAAPIQINYLGYPGTMGTDFIDYIIADEIVVPDGFDQFYSEKIIRLPICYQVNDSKRQKFDIPVQRCEVGLPEDAFVFCCFNNNFKITPDVFDVWCRLLRQVNGSVLWLLADNNAAKENLLKEAVSRGIEPGRLVFAQRVRPEIHLARHGVADLFLDCFPCSAHTTASDALFAGLPILTIAGETFASRVATSLLTSIGLSDMSAASIEEYEKKALVLARNPELILTLKQYLADQLAETALYNTALFTRALEHELLKLYARVKE